MLNDKTHFHAETPQAVRLVLESARINRQRIRLWLGDVKSGKSWNEEFDVIGRISRSMGPMQIPILLRNSRSSGGGGILDHCIVAIATAPGRFAYKHPQFDVGAWTTGPAQSEGYIESAFCNGELHAQFKKVGSAARYVAFMRGERFAK